MNEQELQQAFIQWLAQKLGVQDESQLKQAVQEMGQEGLQQAYQQFMQEMQQQQAQKAKFGAKLNYIKGLNGQCPEGTEMQYFKEGGTICKKCVAKQKNGDKEYDPVEQFKCGRKMKKKKCEAGGTVNIDKCGAKIKKKKCENGGFISFDKCGNKIKKKKCENGGFVPFDKCGNKMKKKLQKGGWIDKKKGIWNWDSNDRFERIKKYYRGEIGQISDDDMKYLVKNPELESFLHNIYKTSKLKNKRTESIEAQQDYVNNFPEGADPKAYIASVPDSANNYKGRIGIGKFKMLPKQRQQNNNVVPEKSSGSGLDRVYEQSRQQQAYNEAQSRGYMGGATNDFENMVVRENGVFGPSNWKENIKTYKDPKSGKILQYITVDGINYFNNGRYWDPSIRRGGNYTYTPGWRIFGGGFKRN